MGLDTRMLREQMAKMLNVEPHMVQVHYEEEPGYQRVEVTAERYPLKEEPREWPMQEVFWA